MLKLGTFLPAGLRRVIRRWVKRRLYRGDYATWEAACARSEGYDSEEILAKAIQAARAVRDGRAAWERDTVLFQEPACNEPLLRALRQAEVESGGRLSVLDFGGALGSTWWQHRRWLEGRMELRWSVVEQPAFVEAGRREFTDGPLRFYETIDQGFVMERPNVVLLSSVLPYLERPHDLLADIAKRDCGWIVIDRTGFTRNGRDRLTVQHVPASIYRASYPCWFFDQERLLASAGEGWRVEAEWPTFDGSGDDFEYRGIMLKRTTPAANGAAQ
jgi:putative methyltransferase (TIGR04325 family)